MTANPPIAPTTTPAIAPPLRPDPPSFFSDTSLASALDVPVGPTVMVVASPEIVSTDVPAVVFVSDVSDED